jgi:PEP-CTERM motif
MPTHHFLGGRERYAMAFGRLAAVAGMVAVMSMPMVVQAAPNGDPASACGAVVGATMPRLCASTEHAALLLSNPTEKNTHLHIDEVTPDSLVITYDVSRSFQFANNELSESSDYSGVISLGPNSAKVLAVDGYRVDVHSATLYGSALVTGQFSTVGLGSPGSRLVQGEAGVTKSVSFQDSRAVRLGDGWPNVDDLIASGHYDMFMSVGGFSSSLFGVAFYTERGTTMTLSFDKIVFNVSVVAVPEPSSWALMGLGLLALAAAVRPERS